MRPPPSSPLTSLPQDSEEVFHDKLGGPDGGKGGVIAVDRHGN